MNILSALSQTQTHGASARQAIERDAAGVATDPARKVAEEFEGFFIARMFDQMNSELKVDGPFGGGAGEKAFRGMLNDEYAKAVTKAGGVGIADDIYRTILSMQEA